LKRGLYILKYASCGANLFSQRNPDGGQLFNDFRTYLYESLHQLEEAGFTPTAHTVLGMQCESDANTHMAPYYEARTKSLIHAVDEDVQNYFALEEDDKIDFVGCKISDGKNPNGTYIWSEYSAIKPTKKNAVVRDPEHRFLVESAKLVLVNSPNDLIITRLIPCPP
jgi:hypothetical protein